jgi:hypothetical protein
MLIEMAIGQDPSAKMGVSLIAPKRCTQHWQIGLAIAPGLETRGEAVFMSNPSGLNVTSSFQIGMEQT